MSFRSLTLFLSICFIVIIASIILYITQPIRFQKIFLLISNPSSIAIKNRAKRQEQTELSQIYTKLSTNPKPWMVESVKEDFSFSPYASNLTQNDYDDFEKYIIEGKKEGYTRVKIVNNQVYFKNYFDKKLADNRPLSFMKALMLINQFVNLPDVEFFFIFL
ncbi:MAG: hypothetical protein SFT91_02360 [Rickettsiaceae bacterium]|nr:hypothetical protein [Rickettsiaceae bacterium]